MQGVRLHEHNIKRSRGFIQKRSKTSIVRHEKIKFTLSRHIKTKLKPNVDPSYGNEMQTSMYVCSIKYTRCL